MGRYSQPDGSFTFTFLRYLCQPAPWLSTVFPPRPSTVVDKMGSQPALRNNTLTVSTVHKNTTIQMPTPPATSAPRPSSSVSDDDQGWDSLTVQPNSPASSYMYPPYSPPPSIYRPRYPAVQPYPPYQAPENFPTSAFSSDLQQPHHSHPSFSSFASITPTPSPPGYHFRMSEMDDDDRSGQPSEDWRSIEDKVERRKVQNRNAQRKHRESLNYSWIAYWCWGSWAVLVQSVPISGVALSADVVSSHQSPLKITRTSL